MKKLQILKALIDFIWFVTCIPMIGLLLFFAVFIFINPDGLSLVFDTKDFNIEGTTITIQVFGLLYIGLALLMVYCFYLFRKALRYFQKAKPFHEDVISQFFSIGKLLTVAGTASTVITFVSYLVFTDVLKINLGLSPHLIVICLGLFFMVLSEIFKVAKHAKEENELTV